jgi:hypothetical protein
VALTNSRASRTNERRSFRRYSFVLAKQNGSWLIAHQHSSLLPKPQDA